MQPLTFRAIALGAFIGVGLGVANLVFSLKTGLSVGVALTAVTIAGALRRTARTPFSTAEGATVQSVASAAGFSTGSTLAASVAAWVLLNGSSPSWLAVAAWATLVSLLGCLLAWPLRRSFLEGDEALPFPSGTAAASAIESLWKEGKEAVRQVRVLLAALVASTALTVLRDGAKLIPATLFATPMGFGLDVSLLALGAGVLLGLRIGLSLLLGAVLAYGLGARVLGFTDFGTAAGFMLWPGVALFTGSSAAHFIASLLKLKRKPPASGEVPLRGHLVWTLSAAFALGLVVHFAFGVSLPAIAISLALAVPLCFVSARVTGETDVTPAGPLGQLEQLAVAPFASGAANAMGGGIAAGAAASAADLMTDLKTGVLLKVDPRRQLVAQLIGCVVGGVLVAPFFVLLVPGPSALGPTGFGVPAAQLFVSTARLLSEGAAALPPGALPVCLACLAAGVVLAALEARFVLARTWLPSPTALGLSMLLPPSLSLVFALGAFGAFVWTKRRKAAAEALASPLAAGLIAGESLAGAALAIRASVS